MLVKELYTTDNGFMANVFEKNFADLYSKCFGDANAKDLDSYVIYNWGNRLLLSDDIDTNNSIINACITINSDRWDRLFQTLYSDYDVFNTGKTTTDKETTSNDTNVNDTQTTSKTTYDNSAFKDTDKVGNVGTTNQKTTRENTHVETDNTNNTERVEKEVSLRYKAYENDVLKTLIDEITLKIFDI